MGRRVAHSAGDGRTGIDLLLLTIFPIAYLAFTDDMPGRLEFGDPDRKWIVSSDPVFGLLTFFDILLWLVLMELSSQQGWPSHTRFTRYQLCQALNLKENGKAYDRIKLGLNRLASVTFETNHVPHAARQNEERWQKFRILDAYELTGNPTDRPLNTSSERSSWIRWSPTIREEIAAGRTKPIDLGFCRRLTKPTALQLYRYLSARRGGDNKDQFRIGLHKLCHERLGITRSARAPSALKKRLEPAHRCLVDAGLLRDWKYEMTDSGEEMVIYYFRSPAKPRTARRSPSHPRPGTRLGESPTPVETADPAIRDLAARLSAEGIVHKVALCLAATDPKECERQLRWLPERHVKTNRAGFLRRAIEGRWEGPNSSGGVTAECEKRRQPQGDPPAQRAGGRRESSQSASDLNLALLPKEEQQRLPSRVEAKIQSDRELQLGLQTSPAFARMYETRHEKVKE